MFFYTFPLIKLRLFTMQSPLKACVTCESHVFPQRNTILSVVLMHIFYMQKTHTKSGGEHFIQFSPFISFSPSGSR